MPSVMSVDCDDGILKFKSEDGINQIDPSMLPELDLNTPIPDIENFINFVWLPPLLKNNFQVRVHIFSLVPRSITIWTGDIGVSVPDNWWDDPFKSK